MGNLLKKAMSKARDLLNLLNSREAATPAVQEVDVAHVTESIMNGWELHSKFMSDNNIKLHKEHKADPVGSEVNESNINQVSVLEITKLEDDSYAIVANHEGKFFMHISPTVDILDKVKSYRIKEIK